MKKIKLRLIMIITIIFIILCQAETLASERLDVDDYNPNKSELGIFDIYYFTNMANPIIGTIRVIGIVVAVIMMIVIGLKYMTGSVSEKAEYKKSMIPYLVGIVLVVSITQIIALIIQVVGNIGTAI